jgi:plasmid stabilization system protein ParE
MPAFRVGVLQRALADIERIAAHPEIGHKVGLRAYPGARTYLLPRSEYVVIYNVDDERSVVAVARVRSARRRPLARSKRR